MDTSLLQFVIQARMLLTDHFVALLVFLGTNTLDKVFISLLWSWNQLFSTLPLQSEFAIVVAQASWCHGCHIQVAACKLLLEVFKCIVNPLPFLSSFFWKGGHYHDIWRSEGATAYLCANERLSDKFWSLSGCQYKQKLHMYVYFMGCLGYKLVFN